MTDDGEHRVEDHDVEEFWTIKAQRIGGLIFGTLFVIAGAFSFSLLLIGKSKPNGQTLFWSLVGVLMGVTWIVKSRQLIRRRRDLLRRYGAQRAAKKEG